MLEETSVCFGPFRLDYATEGVWHGQEARKLTRKAFSVLRYLVEHPGQLVSKEALFRAVWPEVVVGDAALTVCIRELRQVLGDNAKTPQYIETIYGRGYRFIAAVTAAPGSRFEFPSSPQHPAPTLVGREAELVQLREWLEKAATGHRQIVFITGEPGIGKTTVVEAFLAGIRDQGTGVGKQKRTTPIQPIPDLQLPTPVASMARGQCIAHYGAGEGYLPILTALEYLCREPSHEQLVSYSANMPHSGWHSYHPFSVLRNASSCSARCKGRPGSEGCAR